MKNGVFDDYVVRLATLLKVAPDDLENQVAAALTDFMRDLQAGQSLESPAYKVPGPYDVAMAFGPALMASGHYETAEAAMAAAWFAVPAFFSARDAYLRDMVPALYGVSALDPDRRPAPAVGV